MTHVLDLSGSYEAMFNLRHLALGSKPFCEREGLQQGDEEYTPEEWGYYHDQLHFIVSRTLINCAIYVRVFHDSLLQEHELSELQETETALTPDDVSLLGVVLSGEVNISLREICNKIIHSSSFELDIEDSCSRSPDSPVSFWTGRVILSGSKGGDDWAIQVNVITFSDLVDGFIEYFGHDFEWR